MQHPIPSDEDPPSLSPSVASTVGVESPGTRVDVGATHPRHDHGALETSLTDEDASPYGLTFWICYAANTATMVAVSCTFRFADFVHYYGGTEFLLGLIVGVGTVGALLARGVQAFGLDRVGPRRMWLACLACYVAGLMIHPWLQRIDGSAVLFAQVLMRFGLAGAFGASLTFISQTAPAHRMGELLGMLGTSGFVGLAIGPTLSDWLLGAEPGTVELHRMFYLAASLGGFALLMAWCATRQAAAPLVQRFPSWKCVKEFHSGTLLFVAAAMGLGLGLPGVFLRSFAREQQLGGIGQFFLIYSAVALVVRVTTRSLSDRIGVRPVVMIGLGVLALSMLSYLSVQSRMMLTLPAVITGCAHALLFPAVVSGGNRTFPPEWRGLATTVTLTCFDIGNMLGQPLVGLSLTMARQWHLPAYAVMFVFVATLVLMANLAFIWRPPAALAIHANTNESNAEH